uniref:NADH dehydrogenase subunit 4L n=1 Tax=Lepidotrigona flavibasis TaxID=2696055 RepID=A0A6B9MP57_9HYME|nr:NADH dehydrogenase subunit 4L [Lepidotrigona flavibasis]
MTLLFVMNIIFMSFYKFYYYLSFLITMELVQMIFLYFLITYKFSIWTFFLFLMYSVCEGVLGLLIMISVDNEIGHQKILFMNLYY